LKAVVGASPNKFHNASKNGVPHRWWYFAGIAAVALVLLANTVLTVRECAWEDEIFAVSTAWSIVHSKPPVLSVLAQYPGTGSPLRFYGPVSFEAEALLIRAFGLSATVWRLACLAGVILSIWASLRLVKLAGGDNRAGFITASIIALSGSVAPFPGRWDAVTSGLFLTGLLFFLRGAESTGKPSVGWTGGAGVCIGFALASSPRALTLVLAALIAAVLVSLCFRRIWKRVMLGSLGTFAVAALIQTLLLLPAGENSISWYLYLRRATRADFINATPLIGQGGWNLDWHHHKTLVILFVLLFLIFMYGVITQLRSGVYRAKLWLKVFLTFFAIVNLALMLVLLANALGQSVFWLPPAVAAFTCWVNWGFPQDKKLGAVAISLLGICVALLLFQEAEQLASVVLTWNRRTTDKLRKFVEVHVPDGATVYGPIGRYFYAVELSGHQYLYTHEQTTPGLYSETQSPIADKLDAQICSHATYAIWSKPDPIHQPQEEPMPAALQDRLDAEIGEFNQPPLTAWRERVLERFGEIGGKYGFPDAVIYSLRSLTPCPKNGQ
jgi:hypothetical protein